MLLYQMLTKPKTKQGSNKPAIQEVLRRKFWSSENVGPGPIQVRQFFFLKKTDHVENFGPIVLSEQQVIRDT